MVFLAMQGLSGQGGGWSCPQGGAGTGRRRCSLDGYSPHSAEPGGRKPQRGSSSWGELDLLPGALQLELSLGKITVGAAVEPEPLPCRGMSLSLCNHFYTSSFSWDMSPCHRWESLDIPKFSQPGSGRAGMGTQTPSPDKGLPYEGGEGLPLSTRGQLAPADLASFFHV